MHFFKSKKMITVILTVIIVGAMGTAMFLKNYKELNIVRASATDNVHGFAWSELYGWISFNSDDLICVNAITPKTAINGDCSSLLVGANCGTGGKCVKQDKTCSNDHSIFCASSADCGGSACNSVPFGTKIDVNTGSATGYAWNPLLGYICVGSTCAVNSPDSVLSVANYNRLNGKLSGWANVLSQGANGWIKFDNTATPANGVFIDAGTGIATGWAWNGNGDDGNVSTFDGVGWISFNCNDADAGGCASSNYAVTANVNRPPNLSNVDVDYTGVNDPCLDGNTVTRVALKWTFEDDDLQSGYKIELSPAAAGPYTASTTDEFGYMAGLAYGTNYTYTLTVYDSGNPNLSTTTTGSFITKPNEYPEVSFSWYAPNASAEEEIMFVGVSQYYTPALPAIPTTCIDAACSWQWATTEADTISAPTASSTMITFAQKGENDIVTFTAKNIADNLSCSTSTTMSVSEKLPDWQEGGN